jgi:hypothetical protein
MTQCGLSYAGCDICCWRKESTSSCRVIVCTVEYSIYLMISPARLQRTEGGTTPPLAHKCKDQFPDLFIYIPLADFFIDKTAPL